MGNIFAQMNPMALIGVAVLVLASVAGVLILRLIRKGRANSARDLVQIARNRAAAAKETKAATKRAEAANAEPVASSRLSRIGAKGAEPRVESVIDWGEGPVAAAVPDEVASDDPLETAVIAPEAEMGDAPEAEMADAPDLAEIAEPVEAVDTAAPIDDNADTMAALADSSDDAASEPISTPASPIDLADPANHPASWDGLVAIIDRLDAILAEPWHEDALAPMLVTRLAAARDAAGENADSDGDVRNLARQLASTDLARTINNAAREQAAEIVVAVREFAHQGAFSPDDCDAVLQTMQQVEWMALIARDNALEKRTVPLTRHDPEAPLWVAAAFDDMRAADLRSAA